MSNPWNGKVVLQVFWWNSANSNYANWYTYLTYLAPVIAGLGFDGIWVPPPCKDSATYLPMGYTPYDYYDIGQKKQAVGVSTQFGSQDELLRMIAVAHANGLEVYPDLVLDHCSNTSNSTDYQFNGFAAPGRWPHSWYDFHNNPVHENPTGDWAPGVGTTYGNDICYQGRCSDTGQADENCYMRAQARAWMQWFVRQTGVDGFRFDDVKGFPPEVVEDILYNAMGDRLDYFCVGEYFEGGPSPDLDNWSAATLNRSGTFDYPFRFALGNMVASGGFYNVGGLPALQQQNRCKTVPFINNHDNYDSTLGSYISPDDARTQLAYAVAMTVDGSPQLFYPDLYENFANTPIASLVARPWMANLVWCHQKLEFKSGAYFVRYEDSEQLLILERGARAIVAINNDGAAWHSAWIATAFAPNTQLHDYSGSRPDDIWTNADGWVEMAVPPLSYSVWGPAGVSGGFAPVAKRTVQQFEMADDLGDNDAATPQYGGAAIAGVWRNAGAVWPAVGSTVNVFVYAAAEQNVELQVMTPGGTVVLAGGASGPDAALTGSFVVAAEGRHLLQARLGDAAAAATTLYVKTDYMGPVSIAPAGLIG